MNESPSPAMVALFGMLCITTLFIASPSSSPSSSSFSSSYSYLYAQLPIVAAFSPSTFTSNDSKRRRSSHRTTYINQITSSIQPSSSHVRHGHPHPETLETLATSPHIMQMVRRKNRFNFGNAEKEDGDPQDEKQQYLQELREAAKDPIKFEAFVMKQRQKEEGKSDASSSSTTTTTKTSGYIPPNQSAPTNNTNNNNDASPKRGYVPIEQWNEEQVQKAKNGTLSWEERVQFDGQRYGDKFQQNEILRKHLNGW